MEVLAHHEERIARPVEDWLNEKICSTCKTSKIVEGNFSKRADSKDGHHTVCRVCDNVRSKLASREKYKDPVVKIKKAAYRAKHKERAVTRARKWKADNPEKFRDSYLKRMYNISLEDYDQIWAKQEGCCAICGTDDFSKGRSKHPYVDHCHETGEVRGLLCNSCNVGLGAFKDNVILLDKAKGYLDDT